MRHNTIITLTFILFLAFMTYCVSAQTNVSGGIYTNTTWTLANSPYIVVDTVVVFPNVTLTIQPGVTVKFNNDKRIEIRQGEIIAEGTINDSIFFTSSSSTPVRGIWDGVYLNLSSGHFNHCHFLYAARAIYSMGNGTVDSLFCKNSFFENNTVGIGWIYSTYTDIDSSEFTANDYGIKGYVPGIFTINNSSFSNNQYGVFEIEQAVIKNCIFQGQTQNAIKTSQGDSIYNCILTNNNTAIVVTTTGGFGGITVTRNIIENNSIGIDYSSPMNELIYCNRICNNSIYGLRNNNNTNFAFPNNYWCTTDSISTSALIYDGYDNINLGLISYMPIDTFQCYLDSFVPPCSAEFTLYPDTSTLHNWFAIANVTGTSPIDYTWDWGDGSSSTGAYPSHTYDTAGYYNICLTIVDSSACTTSYCDASTYIYKTEATMATVNVVAQLPIGIKDLAATERVINIFPNPATSTFKISLSLTSVETISLTLYNQLGQAVNRQELKNTNGNITAEIDVSQIPTGLYFLTIKGNGWLTTKKILKD